MATRAITHVDGQPYVSPKTQTGRAPLTLADNGENFLELAKEFHTKVVGEFAARAKNQQDKGLVPETHVIEFVVDGEVVDPATV